MRFPATPSEATSPGGASEEKIFERTLRGATLGLAIALGLPGLVLLGLVLFLLHSAGWVNHTSQVIAAARTVERRMVDLEMKLRGDRLAGEAALATARERIGAQVDALAALVADNPGQTAAVAALRGRMAAWFAAGDEAHLEVVRMRIAGIIMVEEDLRTQRAAALDRGRLALFAAIALFVSVAAPVAILGLRGLLRRLSGSYRANLAAAEQRASELRVSLRSIGDAVVTTNAAGEVVLLNPVAERLMGWTTAEAQGLALTEVFQIFNEQTSAPAENPVARVLRERVVVGLANHTVLRARDGRETPIEDSAAPILDDAGEVQGVILVFRDVTEKRQAQEALRERALLAALRADIASQLASSGGLDAILQHCCALLVRYLDAAFARVWTLSATEPVLELQASAGLYTHLDGPHARVPVRQFKIGRIAQSRQPHLTNDVAHDPNIGDPEWARREGMAAFAGYPLLVGGRVLGVLGVFSRRALSEAVLGDLAPIADGIALCIERKRAEAELHSSETLKTAIIDTSLDGLILMDHEGRIAAWSAAAEGIFGMSRTAAIGRLLGDTIVPERLREAHRIGLARYVATREGRILGKRYELPALRADGSEFPCEISISHIPGTEPPLFAGFVRDITERKLAQAALSASEERLRFMAETMPQKIFTAKATGEVDYFNQQWMEFTGLSFEQIRDWGWTQFIHPEDLEANVQRWRHSIDTGESFQIEHRFRRADGAWRWHLSRARPLRDAAGRVLMWIGSNTDVDDVKRSEQDAERARQQAEDASKAKDDFLAALSHELRTPLTPVLMTAAALREDERLPADAREQLGMMERNIALEARLIDDLLDLTRIAKGKLPLRPQVCEAHSLIGLAVEIVRDEAQAKSIALELDLTARRTGLLADPARFQQVIWNLLRNAVKFTPRGGRIAIHTRDAAADDEPGRLCIEVTDSGIGIAPEALDKIFLPFEQAGLTGVHRFGGMGLGLAIARAIVDLHGGTIHAESAGKDRGASFVVELPGATEPPSGVTAASTQPLLAGASPLPIQRGGPGLRLLLVEDHAPTLQVLARLLARAGHSVVTASSVADGLAAAAAGTFDLVISDLGLPDGTGTELMQKLRDTHGLRGIALSGYGMEEDLARSRDAGFAMHLIKPVDFNQLQRAVRELSAGDPAPKA